MVDVVLMELEGVAATTRAHRRTALRRALADEGVTLADDAALEDLAGLPVATAVRAALTQAGRADDETAADLATLRAERLFGEALGKGLALTEGAREFVEAARGRARLAVVTRATRREADLVLRLAGLEDAFECVIAAEDAGEPKPSAEGYRRAIARLERRRPVTRSSAVALEDGAHGIRAAREAGVRVIAVGDLPAHTALAADAWIPSLAGQSVESLAGLLEAEGVR